MNSFKNKCCFLFFIPLLFSLSFSLYAKDRLPVTVKQQLLTGNFQEAIKPLQQLASDNNSEAQYQLGLCYLHGRGVEKSPIKAEEWLQKAAQHHAKASYLLGSFYAAGKLFEKDEDKAETFLLLAQKQGNNKANKLLAKLKRSKARSNSTQSQLLSGSIIKAITADNLGVIQNLEKKGVNFQALTSKNESPLMLAISTKHTEIALWLLTNLSDDQLQFNQQNHSANNALHLSLIHQQQKVSHEILNHVLSFKKSEKNKQTNKQLQQFINSSNSDKQTPLMLAIINENAVFAQRLINQDAQLTLKDKYQKTALNYALTHKMQLVFKRDSKTEPILENKKQSSELSANELQGKIRTLQAQIKDQQSPYYQWPILAIAVAQKQPMLINSLLEKKYDPWQVNPQENNAIFIAIQQNSTDIALKLLTSKVFDPSAEQLYPLFKCAINNVSKAKSNSSINKNSNKIQTDHSDVVKRNMSVINALLSLTNENTFTQASLEKTPLWLAIQFNQRDIFLLISKKTPPLIASNTITVNTAKTKKLTTSYLLFASELNLPTLSHLLIAMNVDVNVINDKQRNALWYAADLGNSTLVESLIHAHSKVDQVDINGYTPLIRAVMKDCLHCVESLLNAGANAQRESKSANNALMFAAQNNDKILAVILDYYQRTNKSLNIKQRNRHSLTALMLAVKSKNLKSITLLLKAGANPKRKNENGENSFDLAKNQPKILALLDQ